MSGLRDLGVGDEAKETVAGVWMTIWSASPVLMVGARDVIRTADNRRRRGVP